MSCVREMLEERESERAVETKVGRAGPGRVQSCNSVTRAPPGIRNFIIFPHGRQASLEFEKIGACQSAR